MEMKTQKNNHSPRSIPIIEHRWGHPLLGSARFLGSVGLGTSHAIVVSSVAGVLLLMWFNTIINATTGPLATMTFGVALLFDFAGWIARCSR